jgi:hypothetical protein
MQTMHEAYVRGQRARGRRLFATRSTPPSATAPPRDTLPYRPWQCEAEVACVGNVSRVRDPRTGKATGPECVVTEEMVRAMARIMDTRENSHVLVAHATGGSVADIVGTRLGPSQDDPSKLAVFATIRGKPPQVVGDATFGALRNAVLSGDLGCVSAGWNIDPDPVTGEPVFVYVELSMCEKGAFPNARVLPGSVRACAGDVPVFSALPPPPPSAPSPAPATRSAGGGKRRFRARAF